jgi:mRNA interferase MazF
MSPESSELRRGQIYWIDWNPARGSEQAGYRPGLIVQNDPFNRNERYPNTVVVAISTSGRSVPSHVALDPNAVNGLRDRSYVKCEQLVTISKDRLREQIGALDDATMLQVDRALIRVLALS